MWNKLIIGFWGLLVILEPAQARGVGRGRIATDYVRAACVLHIHGSNLKFGSGTLVKIGPPGSQKLGLVTAGHIADQYLGILADLTVSCDCPANEPCRESFSVDLNSEVWYKYDTLLMYERSDHALLPLQGEFQYPSQTSDRVLKVSTRLTDYFDFGGRVLPGARCLKGGFGINESQAMASVPKLYQVLKITKDGTYSNPQEFLTEILGKFPYQKILNVNHLVDPNQRLNTRARASATIARLANDGDIPNSLMSGDSGSGLICQSKPGGDFALIGLLTRVALAPSQWLYDEPTPKTEYRVSNSFSMITEVLEDKILGRKISQRIFSPIQDHTYVTPAIRTDLIRPAKP